MKVIIADSNELLRVGLRTTLQKHDRVEELIEVKNSEELRAISRNIGKALVIIDYTAPGFDINDVASSLRLNPKLRFIGLTYLQSAQTLVDALRGGVMSYIKKDCSLSEISDAVNETAAGKKFFCGKILDTINKANLNPNELEAEALTCDPLVLSERENEIIVLIAEGYTNDQIADLLFLSKHTVNTHRKNILHKLGVKNTAGIVMYAVKTQLISPNKFLFASN
ncbi:MAG: response regulator transcription factor [Bacteroidetes bacterium]|nr:response regulator transcription factor [Bacteroidota bacterium]MBM3424035.1 response regulator transcription factor [Bacteroidota bacterium]